MIYFTSDLHFGHQNIIHLCNRPFLSVEEMDTTLIHNWNKKVHRNDIVYILGDLMFRNEKAPEEYLQQLKGRKHLLLGNHDNRWIKDCHLSLYFESVERLDFVSGGKRKLTLCHYPLMSWPHIQTSFMVFGHIHNNTDADYWPLIAHSPRMLNAGVDINNYEPVTFEEMEANNKLFKSTEKENISSVHRL